MPTRSAVVLVEDDHLYLIERRRAGTTYHLFSGGTVDDGETLEQAARREAFEELGLHVRIGSLVASMRFDGNDQFYFRATIIGGTFGHGTGEELASPPDSPAGTYRPVRIPLHELDRHDVRPKELLAQLASLPPTD